MGKMYAQREIFSYILMGLGIGAAIGAIITAVILSTIFFLLLMTWG